jgi:trk system potassium uptake protein TrkA
MKIIILGAGQVGSTLAENLASEYNDITIVDTKIKKLRDLSDRLDIQIVEGEASHPDILVQAGLDDADMLVAVTNSDEVNMIACQLAWSLFRTPRKIARIRANAYLEKRDELFNTNAIPIDVLISPEQVVCDYITRLIETPGALQVLDFADNLVQLVGMKAVTGGPLVGQELRYLRQHIPSVDTRVAAIFRKDRSIFPVASTVVESDDEVFFIAAKNDIRSVMNELRRHEKPYKRIVIAGGGNIGFRLAKSLEKHFFVKIIDRGIERSQWLSENLSATVLLGNVANQELLIQEDIENADVFIAVTNDDEANIMASMLAKRLGARKVMTLINNSAYVDLVQGGDIDVAISPSQATIGSLLTHVRRADIVSVHKLRRGAAEAIEAIAHGDKKSSRVVGRCIEDLDLPEGCTIGAIVRDGKVLIAHDDVEIASEDHVIMFLTDRRLIPDVERLFQVGFTFF